MSWYEVQSQIKDGEADIFVYDEIGLFGVSANQLIAEVQALKPQRINLHINSPGGSIYDGWAMYTYLKSHAAPVTTYIDSSARSMAGVVAMSGDEVVMLEGSLLHMHLPGVSGWINENVEGLEDLVKELRKMDGLIRAMYQRRTGASDAQLAEWFKGDTYFTPEEALRHGLIDRIAERTRLVACDGRWNPRNYSSSAAAGADLNLDLRGAADAHAAHSHNPHNPEPKEPDMSKELEQKIATLEAEAKLSGSTIAELEAKIEAAHAQIETARTEAGEQAMATEKNRREAIIALRDKYNQSGDLDDIALNAIADGQDADAFKDVLLDTVAKRPTTRRAESGNGQGQAPESKTMSEYLALNHADRRAFKKSGGIVVDEN